MTQPPTPSSPSRPNGLPADLQSDLPFSPAADRNKDVVLEVLSRLLPAQATVLEVASGTGQHAAHCAAAQPGWHWQPTDHDAQALPAITARCAALPNVWPAQRLDVLTPAWWQAHRTAPPEPGWQAIYCANMIHIAPWTCCLGLLAGAAELLAGSPGGKLVLYGPYLEAGVPTAPSNLAFDASLRERDPAWGIRQLAEVEAAAAAVGLGLQERIAVPANNLMLVLAPSGRG